jgi:hypothetical protein
MDVMMGRKIPVSAMNWFITKEAISIDSGLNCPGPWLKFLEIEFSLIQNLGYFCLHI